MQLFQTIKLFVQLEEKERGEHDPALPGIPFTGKEEDGRVPRDLSLQGSIGLYIVSSPLSWHCLEKGQKKISFHNSLQTRQCSSDAPLHRLIEDWESIMVKKYLIHFQGPYSALKASKLMDFSQCSMYFFLCKKLISGAVSLLEFCHTATLHQNQDYALSYGAVSCTLQALWF